MPENPSPRRPVRVSLDQVATVLQQTSREEQEREVLERMIQGVQSGAREKARVVCRRVHGVEHVPDLYGRHERVLVAERIAKTILTTGGDLSHPEMIALRSDLEKHGGMLNDRHMGYDEALFAERLTDMEHWLVLQAGIGTGEIDAEGEPVIEAPIADIQVQIADDASPRLVAFVPEETDAQLIYPTERARILQVIKDIRKNPAILACIEDVTVDPEWQGKGVGRALIQDARRRLRLLERLNAVQKIVASMFVLHGVSQNEKMVTLLHAIYNKVSMILHATTQGGSMAWSSPATEVRVTPAHPEQDNTAAGAVIHTGWETALIDV